MSLSMAVGLVDSYTTSCLWYVPARREPSRICSISGRSCWIVGALNRKVTCKSPSVSRSRNAIPIAAQSIQAGQNQFGRRRQRPLLRIVATPPPIHLARHPSFLRRQDCNVAQTAAGTGRALPTLALHLICPVANLRARRKREGQGGGMAD